MPEGQPVPAPSTPRHIVTLVLLTAIVATFLVMEHSLPIGVVWTVALVGPLVWRRTRPDAVMAALTAAGAVRVALTTAPSFAHVTLLLALFTEVVLVGAGPHDVVVHVPAFMGVVFNEKTIKGSLLWVGQRAP